MFDYVCDADKAERALVWWWNAETQSEWKFCGHHNRELTAWMEATEHRVTRDDRATLLASARQPEPA